MMFKDYTPCVPGDLHLFLFPVENVGSIKIAE